MSYMMRDRPDGQFEIVLQKPILVGVFPERDTAERIVAFLQTNDVDLIEGEPASWSKAKRDVEEATKAETLEDIPETYPKQAEQPKVKAATPAVVAPKRPPAIRVEKTDLTFEQTEAAFARISNGEKIGDVAPDFGVTMGQLRGLWANHCRKLQLHLAEGGQIECINCKKAFTPSLSHPDTCARCSK